MLDEVVVKKAGAKPKLVNSTGGVGTGVRHLSQDELDAYMNGRLPAARLDSCSNHLDSCDACRAELEDLRTFKNSAVGVSQSGSLGRELDRRKRQRQLKAAGSAAMVAVVVAAIAAVGWWQFGRARTQRASVAPTAASAARGSAPVSPVPTGGRATHTTPPRTTLLPGNQLASVSQTRTVPAAARAASPRVAAQPASAPMTTPIAASRVTAQPASAPAAKPAAAAPPASTFSLLGPFGDEIADARPEFAWQPLAGATKYSVVIVDEGLRPVQHSHGVKTTSWRPRRPLRRGRTYLWQVTATLRNGKKVVALAPTSLEARIHIAQTPSGKLTDD